MTSVCVLCGGVGAARFLAGLVRVVDPSGVTAVVNVGDDTVLHELHVSPDLDTVTYTLAGAVNPATGWGLVGETWEAMAALDRYGAAAPAGSDAGSTWFRLGDRDLATHLYRTRRLAEGAALSEVTAEIARAWDLPFAVVPVTDDPLRTMVTVRDADAVREVGFQEYFVRRQHGVPVEAVRVAGATDARPAPGVLEALATADAVIVAPSNPVVSIGPVLAVPGVRDALRRRREAVAAVSPIVGGAALKGPADRMMRELGHEASVVGVAAMYADLAGTLVIDEVDAALAPAVESEGIAPLVAPTVMHDPAAAADLARTVLAALGVAP